ncbi:hypothetical protein [Nonomuraea endophytica]|uniref:hypothetical protein n=1 Tax=Nonomuraea endophytica TaxID=714136 RepID=UPI0037C64B91
MPFNPAAKHTMLNALSEITHLGAHTVTDPGTGTNANSGEATGGSYARQAVSFAASASEQKANSGQVTIPVAAGSYAFVTLWTASSGNSGVYRGYLPINGAAKGFGSVDGAGVTADAIQSAGHGLADNDRVMVFAVFGESLPAGLSEGTILHVVSSATDTFEVSATQGGASVNITGQGELYFQKVIPETFASPGEIVLDVGALILDLTGI